MQWPVLVGELRAMSKRVTIYRDDSTTQVVYEDVKHTFWTANNTVLVIAQLTNPATGAHHYIHWMRERVCWFKTEEGSRVEAQG